MTDFKQLNADLLAGVSRATFNVYTTVPPNIEFPACFAGFPDRLSDFASGGSCTMDHTVTIMVARTDDENAPYELMELISMELLIALMRARGTTISEVAITNVSSFRATTFGEKTNVFAADINLQIRTQ